jgi:glucokinase
MRYAIGVDLGGTNIKIVAVSETGQMLERSTCETHGDLTVNSLEIIKHRIKEIENTRDASANWVGLAAPGLTSDDNLTIACMPGKLGALDGLDWTSALQRAQPVPVLNDAHAALLGEAWLGAGKGCRNVVLLTLGTGVGGALLIEGRLFKGHIGRAGHLGHISLNADGPPDIVGTPGSLEQTIGNATLPDRSAGRFTSTRRLIEAHLSGDEQASKVWLRSVYDLATGLTSIINTLDPEVIIIGGGIAQAGPALFDPLARFLEKLEWRPQGQGVRIIPAVLGSFAGTLGAAHYAMSWAR